MILMQQNKQVLKKREKGKIIIVNYKRKKLTRKEKTNERPPIAEFNIIIDPFCLVHH